MSLCDIFWPSLLPFHVPNPVAVHIKHCIIPNSHVRAGVPQGSLLGLHLFILFTSDKFPLLHTKLAIYVDDTTLYITSRKVKGRVLGVFVANHLDTKHV